MHKWWRQSKKSLESAGCRQRKTVWAMGSRPSVPDAKDVEIANGVNDAKRPSNVIDEGVDHMANEAIRRLVTQRNQGPRSDEEK